MERVKEHEFRALSTSEIPQWMQECNNDGAHPKSSGFTALSMGKRPSIGEDEGGGAEPKLLGKGIAATSLLQIAIRNGIYQNQAANAISSGAKNINIPAAKTGTIYNISPVNSSNSNSLSKRRQRHKRNLSLGCAARVSPSEVASPAPSASPLSTLSLDRKTFLRQKQLKQLQASDKGWVTSDIKRGCIHVHDWLTPSHPRPVLCTLDTTAAQVVSKLQASEAEAVVRIHCETIATKYICKDKNGQNDDLSSDGLDPKDVNVKENESTCRTKHYFDTQILHGKIATNSSSEVCLNDIGLELNLTVADCYGAHSGSDMENSTCEEFSLGESKSTPQQDSLSEGTGLGAESSALSQNCDSATEGPDPFESSSDELDITTFPTHSADPPSNAPEQLKSTVDVIRAVDSEIKNSPQLMKHPSKGCSSSQNRPLSNQASVHHDPEIPTVRKGWLEPINTSPTPALFVQLHGGIVRRLRDHERPLQLLNEYLTNLGFENPWRVQKEGMNPGIGSLICFYFGKPRSVGGSDRLQLSGVFNVRKGKLVLPVNRWSKRQVTLSGTCLIVSSVKHANLGKIHILPLIGGKVEEVKRHNNCLALSSVGPQSQTYYISYESYTEYLRWHRTASKIMSQRVNSVDLSCCSLEELPTQLFYSHDLTHLYLKNNFMSMHKGIPALTRFSKLRTLSLSNNALPEFPLALCDLPSLTELNLSGNCLASLPVEVGNMYTLNRLQSVTVGDMKQLVHIVQLDLRDAGLQELDVRPLCKLEILHCDRNRLSRIRISGHTLKTLHAARNELKEVEVEPFPENLTLLDLSWNKLDAVPNWVCENSRLEVLDINHNSVTELPIRLLSSKCLRKLLAGWNALNQLSESLEISQLEFLELQHNFLMELPNDLFIKAQNLRYLNVSANKLETLPVPSSSEDNSSNLEELYVTNNCLTDKCVPLLAEHGCLRVLHIAYNQLETFIASKLAQLEHLEELDLSGNRLRTVPTTILNCRCLQTISLHSNCINCFPEVLQLPEIKCVDLSCNELTEITLPESLPPTLQELDLTGNPRLNLDHKSLELLNNIRCLRLDPSTSAPIASECLGAPAVWSNGYTEASGVKNNLCVAALAQDTFCGVHEALYGVFDGDKNVEVPYLMQCTMGDVLAEERQRAPTQGDYMTNTFLTMQQKLGTAGQRRGGSAVLCHIKHDPMPPGEQGGCFTLKSANVGRCQAVLCRNGKAMQLSTVHTVKEEMECLRVRQHNAIITEDNRVSGVTDSTRIMGYSFLCPSVIPRPHVSTVTLTPQDEFFLLGSRGLWETLSPGEAVEAVRNVPDPLAAAKKLVTLAQSYGCSDSLSAVVVQLSITEDCCCFCELLPPPPSASLGAHTQAHPYLAGGDLLPPAWSGTVSDLSSEFSTSEMSSEVGSTASSEEPLPLIEPASVQTSLAARAPVHRIARGNFQRQFSGALSDNGLDSEDEEPVPGVFSNGSLVEVEADVHSLQGLELQIPSHLHSGTNALNSVIVSVDPLPTPNSNPPAITPSSPSLGGDARWNSLSRRAKANGSVACQGRTQDLIEEAADAPAKKHGGYFNAPAQPDPEDQLIIPPELEEEVRQIIQQQQMETLSQQTSNYQKPPDYFITPL
ncbi:PH domain leucine-rich repeat protein phosphatase 1-like isoform X2 [Stigmatopora argus]